MALDGFEVVDLSSCMNFPAGTTIEQKRAACRPEVYRYRYPTAGHRARAHEQGQHLRLPRARGLPRRPPRLRGRRRHDPVRHQGRVRRRRHARGLQRRQAARHAAALPGARQHLDRALRDRREGHRLRDRAERGRPRRSRAGSSSGAPSLEGVRYVGSAFHMGRESTHRRRRSGLRLDAGHRLRPRGRAHRLGALHPRDRRARRRRDAAGRHVLAERRQQDRQRRRPRVPRDAPARAPSPRRAEEAFELLRARTPQGEQAILRVPIRTGPQPSLCTAHVFHQIPGQNRIFMGWYSQGTHVIDFEEGPDGTIDFSEVAWFIPQNANQWVSAIFKVDTQPGRVVHLLGRRPATSASATRAATRSTSTRSRCRRRRPRPQPPVAGTGAGFEPPRCVARRARFGRRGLGRLRLGARRSRGVAVARAVPPAGAARRLALLRHRRAAGSRAGRVRHARQGADGREHRPSSPGPRPGHRRAGAQAAPGPTRIGAGTAPARTLRLPHQSGPGALRRGRRRRPRAPARAHCAATCARAASLDSATSERLRGAST